MNNKIIEAEAEAKVGIEAKAKVENTDFDVSDPEILKPKTLPLIVKPKKGSKWANEAQEEYAKTLNGYAYKNSEKWNKKKEGLLTKLKELEANPEKLNLFKGENDKSNKLSYKDQTITNQLN